MLLDKSLQFITFGLVVLLCCSSLIASSMCSWGEDYVGVQKGDWIEYTVSITGGTPPPTHNVNWFRIEILGVQDAAFDANFTVRFVNGTFQSSVWTFNFTEGEFGGWMIIPPNLDVGDRFYDSSKPTTVTIEGEEQKIVADASRTITHASDSIRLVKEWDKATGVFTHSIEQPKNLTIITNAIATNLWEPQILGLDPTLFYSLTGSVVLAAITLSSIVVVPRRNKIKRRILGSFSQGKIAVMTVIIVVLVMIGGLAVFPFFEIGLTFHEINLVMQTFWTALVLLSMWFRTKGNYFAHEITMLIVICGSIVDFSAVLLMSPLSNSSLQIYSTSTLRLLTTLVHSLVSFPALIGGLWLVALWRPESTTFADKSKRIAQITAVSWILSYIVGVLSFVALHTTWFG